MIARAPKLHLDMPFDEALERFAHTDAKEIPPVPKRTPPRGKKRKSPGGKRSRKNNPRAKGHA